MFREASTPNTRKIFRSLKLGENILEAERDHEKPQANQLEALKQKA